MSDTDGAHRCRPVLGGTVLPRVLERFLQLGLQTDRAGA